ncbi:TonB family protein [Oleiharenicola lentus]|jgi:TonB family protein|uniref:TonB family protein n=1 Tax=Oleiharenicola lentus TaxID=2508720 RepID=A0A4Q1C6E7_9BACT|nr:energy transducer TonB [Oleiharenicola lentus]RXK54443.1 TonB family protein [Oleiharenicola lentus]
MKPLLRFLLLIAIASSLLTARAQTAVAPGYKVVVEITFDEQGVAEEGKVVSSDDPSGARVLDQIALRLAEEVKQAPRTGKDGKPVKFKARAPFNFPVEGDEGAAANEAPKPALKAAPLPAYPENLAASGTVGGAIVELVIGADGAVKQASVLRSSHPEFANAAFAAVQQWQFAPAQKDGAAVESRWRVAINFSVDEKEADWMWRVAPRPSLGAFTAVRAKLPPAAPAVAPAEKK